MDRIIDYDTLGMYLLNDKDGSIMQRIKQDYKVTDKIVREIFLRWLRGEGQKNGNIKPDWTWGRLVYYLKRAKYIALAEEVQSILRACNCVEEKLRCGRDSHREKVQMYCVPQDKDKSAEHCQEKQSGFNAVLVSIMSVMMSVVMLYNYLSIQGRKQLLLLLL